MIEQKRTRMNSMRVATPMQGSEIADKIQRFKELFYRVSAGFINLSVVEIDRDIDRKLKFVAEFWDFDLVAAVESSEAGEEMELTKVYLNPKATMTRFRTNESIPWLMKKVRRAEMVALGRLPDELPEDAMTDRETFLSNGIRSALVIPFKVDGLVHGGFIFAGNTERIWSQALLVEFHSVGEIIASALERRRSILRLDNFIRFERRTAERFASYLNLPLNDIEKVIEDNLSSIKNIHKIEKCILYLAGKEWGKSVTEDSFVCYPKADHDLCQVFHVWIQQGPSFHNRSSYYDSLDNYFETSTRGHI
jgi:hypothetical protein